MKNLYGLALQTTQVIGIKIRNSLDYLQGNYAIKKQEKIEKEKCLEAVMKDYDSRISETNFHIEDSEDVDFNCGSGIYL